MNLAGTCVAFEKNIYNELNTALQKLDTKKIVVAFASHCAENSNIATLKQVFNQFDVATTSSQEDEHVSFSNKKYSFLIQHFTETLFICYTSCSFLW